MTTAHNTVTHVSLKPCPFCGSRALDPTCREREGSGARQEYFYVYCDVCQACGPTVYMQANAIKQWNTRSNDDDN
jgi:Lar family restriction alleviation protein